MFFRISFYMLLMSFLLAENISKSEELIPDVILKDINKKKIKLLDTCKDNYVLFNFWNMACEPC